LFGVLVTPAALSPKPEPLTVPGAGGDTAEVEEHETYTPRMSDEWRLALAPSGTDWIMTHITNSPWIAILFKRSFEIPPDGERAKN
jgi:iodotyrosine deiodinase